MDTATTQSYYLAEVLTVSRKLQETCSKAIILTLKRILTNARQEEVW